MPGPSSDDLSRRLYTLEQERALEDAYPSIPWRKPVHVVMAGCGAEGFACRFCIALHGLNEGARERLFADRAGFDVHMAEMHPTREASSTRGC